mgnify:CR=1 FL=1
MRVTAALVRQLMGFGFVVYFDLQDVSQLAQKLADAEAQITQLRDLLEAKTQKEEEEEKKDAGWTLNQSFNFSYKEN